MQKYNIINLLKLQDKNIKLDNYKIDPDSNTAFFFISKKVTEHSCPCCGNKTKRIHDHRNQIINHSPLNGYFTKLVLKKTRLLCTNCGKKFYMNYNNIVNPKFRCSNSLFFDIINMLKNTSMTFEQVASFFGVSSGVVTKYLNFFSFMMNWNCISHLPKHIGIDEFKGNCDGSKYLFHVYDLDTKETVTILKSRKYDEIVEFFNSITNRNDVEIVTMDLYDTFRNAVKTKLKKATIIADRFHYTRIIAKALDEIRLELWRNATNSTEKRYLKNLKLALLTNVENVDSDKALKILERLNYAFDLNPTLKSAYELYQSFLRIKDGDTYQEKVKRLRDWLDDALSSTLTKFESAAKTLINWNKEVVNSLKYDYTNSATEGKNNKIKVIKRNAYGFRKLVNLSNLIKIRDLKHVEI